MMKVLVVIGTRPEAIKMAPVIAELKKHQDKLQCLVCATGQHRQMLDQVLDLFQVGADIDLNVMTSNQTLSGLTAQLLVELQAVILEHGPDWVLAQGDTTTVMVASLVCYYNRIRFGHVEAGLRTRQKYKPFPEEVNRCVADLVADMMFAPTEIARQALLCEGRRDEDIYVTGNTVIDALRDVAARPFDFSTSPLRGVDFTKRLVLVTAHRRESFGEPFRQLCLAVRDLAATFPDVRFVYPVHLNPNVREPVMDILANLENLLLLEPLDYLTMVHLLKRSTLVLTDSGGIQEEAPGLSVPVLVMRDTTERPEGVTAGVCKLVGTNRGRIVREVSSLLTSNPSDIFRGNCSPYGDGRAAARIVAALLSRDVE